MTVNELEIFDGQDYKPFTISFKMCQYSDL